MRNGLVVLGVSFLSLSVLAATPPSPPRAETSCIQCHSGEMFDEAARAVVRRFNVDVHSQVGLSCHDCHGGNPDPELGDDIGGAMDPQYKPNPYLGAPKRPGIPDFCGRCHSSAQYMKRFNPACTTNCIHTSVHTVSYRISNCN